MANNMESQQNNEHGSNTQVILARAVMRLLLFIRHKLVYSIGCTTAEKLTSGFWATPLDCLKTQLGTGFRNEPTLMVLAASAVCYWRLPLERKESCPGTVINHDSQNPPSHAPQSQTAKTISYVQPIYSYPFLVHTTPILAHIPSARP